MGLWHFDNKNGGKINVFCFEMNLQLNVVQIFTVNIYVGIIYNMTITVSLNSLYDYI